MYMCYEKKKLETTVSNISILCTCVYDWRSNYNALLNRVVFVEASNVT